MENRSTRVLPNVTDAALLLPVPPHINTLPRVQSVRGGRPQTAPLGPRVRQSSAYVLDTTNGVAPQYTARAESSAPTSTTGSSSSPVSVWPPPSPRTATDTKSQIQHSPGPSRPTTPPPPPPPLPPQRALTPTPTPAPTPTPTPPPALVKTVVPKFVPITPPPKLDFDTAPIPWKGLPLEAAQWTLSSQELQEIVSRAIRSSARESFIRLLSVNTLDTALPAELERLDNLKAVTQSKYRFLVHRRTMLLQALNSAATVSTTDGAAINRLATQLCDITGDCDRLTEELVRISNQESQIQKLTDVHWASALAIALRKLNGSYGRRTKDLVEAKGKISQLEADLEDAWKAAEKIAQELDELDEQDAAQAQAEADAEEYQASSDSDDDGEPGEETVEIEEAVIERAEIIAVPKSPPTTNAQLEMSSPRLMAVGQVIHSESIQAYQNHKRSLSQTMMDIPPPLSLDPTPPPMTTEGEEQEQEQEQPQMTTEPTTSPDTATIHSARSGRSGRSGRSARSVRSTTTSRTGNANPGETRASQISAAKRRSLRTSLGSLRLASGRPPRIRRGSGNAGTSPTDNNTTTNNSSTTSPGGGSSSATTPPVPNLPRAYAPSSFTHHTNTNILGLSTPEQGSRPTSQPIQPVEARRMMSRRPVSALQSPPSSSSASPSPSNGAMRMMGRPTLLDDIEVVPTGLGLEFGFGLNEDDEDDGRAGAISRSRSSAGDLDRSLRGHHRVNPSTATTGDIPSIWLHADAAVPKTSAERVQALTHNPRNPRGHSDDLVMAQSRSSKTYNKLKTLTKRYSLPFSASVGGIGIRRATSRKTS